MRQLSARFASERLITFAAPIIFKVSVKIECVLPVEMPAQTQR